MLTEYEAQKLQADMKRRLDRFTLDKEIFMVSHDEKERLLRNFRHEPAVGLGVVLKCAACLLILAGLSVIGSTAKFQSEAPFGALVDGGSAHHHERASVVESKKVFDERRARFEGPSVAPQAQSAR